MHVVFFNRSYYPDPEASGQFLTELAEDLARKGERVTVVCGTSYHLDGRRRLPLPRLETHNGVRIVRIWNTRLPKSRLAFRMLNLATYLAGCLLGLCLLRRPDVVVCLTDPPLLPLLAGPYARLAGARFVFAINDLYPDVAVGLNRISNPLLLKLLETATQCGLRHAQVVTVLGEDMKARLLRKRCPAGKVVIMHHWADVDRIRPRKEGNEFRREHGFKPSDFLLMYSGNVGLSQGLEDLLHAVGGLEDSGGLHLLIVGEGADKGRLQAVAAGLGLGDRVRFLPYQPKERLDQSLSAADLHVIPMSRGVTGLLVPSKAYGIMASGTPYLAVMDEGGEVARLARRHLCGLWCPPGSVAELSLRLKSALRDREMLAVMGANGRRAAETEFSRGAASERYHRLFCSLSSAPRRLAG